MGSGNSLTSGSSLSTGGLVINRFKTNTMSIHKEAGERRAGETLLPTVRYKRYLRPEGGTPMRISRAADAKALGQGELGMDKGTKDNQSMSGEDGGTGSAEVGPAQS